MTIRPRRRRVNWLRALLMPVLGVAFFGYASSFGSAEDVTAGLPDPTVVTRQDVLLSAHDCWVGKSPYGDLIPGHAVYALSGHQPVYGPSQVAFDIWLHGVPGIVYGFCR